jgi:hypothetical protein
VPDGRAGPREAVGAVMTAVHEQDRLTVHNERPRDLARHQELVARYHDMALMVLKRHRADRSHRCCVCRTAWPCGFAKVAEYALDLEQ